MTQNLRRWILIGSAAALLLLPVFVFSVDNIRSSGEVARNVSAGGVELGGLGEEEATNAMLDYEAELAQTPAVYIVNDVEFVLTPSEVGLDIDEDAVVATAMDQRREKGLFGSFFSWFGSFGDQIELDVPATLDPELLDEVIASWEKQAIDLPAYEGGIIVRDTRVLPDYPRPGEGIDRDMAQQVVLTSLQTVERQPTVLATQLIQPSLTNADIDAATVEAGKLIDAPVTLSSTDPEFSVTFTQEELAAALETEVEDDPVPQIISRFNADAIGTVLVPLSSEIEQPARNAEYLIDEQAKQVTLVGSRPATVLDTELVADELLVAAASPADAGTFPFGVGADASFTTAEAEAMGEVKFVSEFLTEHPAGQQRVINIHLMADTVDGAMVFPGESFSLNEHVGQRTEEKGYVAAPMILAGELVDDVGGGVSQFATTFYNAVFFGCYEDVDHKPHSYYFSRYPEVNEATISWPVPNLVFRNNTDTVVIIKTQYSDTAIKVQLYGNNDGCVAERQLGSRFSPTEPREEFVANPGLTPLDRKVTQNGWSGFSNTVKRVMTWPDGRTAEEEYVWKYLAAPKIIEVHPCNVPPGSECPVQVPSVIGGSFDGATAALAAVGLTIIDGATIEVTDESQNGLIVDQTPNGGDWVDLGTAITVNIGVYVAPPPEEPPPEEPPPEEPPPDDGS